MPLRHQHDSMTCPHGLLQVWAPHMLHQLCGPSCQGRLPTVPQMREEAVSIRILHSRILMRPGGASPGQQPLLGFSTYVRTACLSRTWLWQQREDSSWNLSSKPAPHVPAGSLSCLWWWTLQHRFSVPGLTSRPGLADALDLPMGRLLHLAMADELHHCNITLVQPGITSHPAAGLRSCLRHTTHDLEVSESDGRQSLRALARKVSQ